MANKVAPRLVLWDTCTLIWCLDHSVKAHVDDVERLYRKCVQESTRAMIAEAKSSQIRIAVSTMAIAETGRADEAEPDSEQFRIIQDFLKHSWIVRISLGLREAHTARRLRMQHPEVQLFNDDLVQVATAVEHNIPELITTDGDRCDRLKQGRREKRGMLKYDKFFKLRNGDPLRIRTPIEHREEIEAMETARQLDEAEARRIVGREKMEAKEGVLGQPTFFAKDSGAKQG